ncbi:hypothetical protein [Nocardioides hwasunensis]|uniref:Uncharacterized protein n=1 Tax=Nocardioides hwasunensis TaxID=397258 RepID=A0ABR8MGK7_9ACTN|nr:hypothetical protein [Nocardioides hwasunensis]MBD3915207.1 hypothetical protein [Nocardioides hwasunensis]
MRINRLVAGTVSAGLLGLAPIAIAAPSHATENRTAAVVATPSAPALTLGDDFSVSVTVTDTADGSSVYNGTSTLYALAPGAAEYAPVATGTSASSSFFDVKPKTNTTYKVVYSGYTATSTYQNNYAVAESAPFTVGVARKLVIKNPRGTFIKGKVKPKYAKKKIVIQKKVGKKWKKFRTLKTNKKSAFQTTLPASKKRTFFRFIVKGNAKYIDTVAEGSTISYRSASPRVTLG